MKRTWYHVWFTYYSEKDEGQGRGISWVKGKAMDEHHLRNLTDKLKKQYGYSKILITNYKKVV